MRRGLTLCKPDSLPMQSDRLTASIFWMSPRPLQAGERLFLRIATQEMPCTAETIADRIDSGTLEVLEAHADALSDTEVAEVTLSLDQPVHYDSFVRIPEMGRLVLMRGADIVAGGIVP